MVCDHYGLLLISRTYSKHDCAKALLPAASQQRPWALKGHDLNRVDAALGSNNSDDG